MKKFNSEKTERLELRNIFVIIFEKYILYLPKIKATIKHTHHIFIVNSFFPYKASAVAPASISIFP